MIQGVPKKAASAAPSAKKMPAAKFSLFDMGSEDDDDPFASTAFVSDPFDTPKQKTKQKEATREENKQRESQVKSPINHEDDSRMEDAQVQEETQHSPTFKPKPTFQLDTTNMAVDTEVDSRLASPQRCVNSYLAYSILQPCCGGTCRGTWGSRWAYTSCWPPSWVPRRPRKNKFHRTSWCFNETC